jgi:hypothetical protein
MSVQGVIYNEHEIKAVYLVPDEAAVIANCGEGLSYVIYLGYVSPDDHYVNEGVVLEKMPMTMTSPTAVSKGEVFTVVGLEMDTTVTWPDGEQTIETDGNASAVMPFVGTFQFVFEHPMFLREEVFVNVTA